MTAPGRSRSTRDRPAKAPLSVESIVDAALAIVRSEGLEALSMRRVAAALDTGAGSLYVYVAGRDGLVEALSDRVTAMIDLETPDPRRWRQQLHTLTERMCDVLIEHPGLAAASMANLPRTEATFLVVENLLGILLAGGIDAQDAAWAADIIAALVTYTAIESEMRRNGIESMTDDIRLNLARLPADRFPLLTAHTEQLVAGDVAHRFRFAIDVVLDGVMARTSSSRPG